MKFDSIIEFGRNHNKKNHDLFISIKINPFYSDRSYNVSIEFSFINVNLLKFYILFLILQRNYWTINGLFYNTQKHTHIKTKALRISERENITTEFVPDALA